MQGVTLVAYDERERCNYQYVVLEVDESATRVSRDHLIEALWAENVIVRKYFAPGCHDMQVYRSLYPRVEPLEATERLAERLLILPTGTVIADREIDAICSVLRLAVAESAALKALLRNRDGTEVRPAA